MLHVPGLYIDGSEEMGRGIFTKHNVPKSTIIEVCPLIKLTTSDLIDLRRTKLSEYFFLWEKDDFEVCLPLGYGCLYNHSSTPNAEIVIDFDEDYFVVRALKEIIAGNQIFIDYRDGDEEKQLWFVPTDML